MFFINFKLKIPILDIFFSKNFVVSILKITFAPFQSYDLLGLSPFIRKVWGMRICLQASRYDLDAASGSLGESYRWGVVPDTLPHF